MLLGFLGSTCNTSLPLVDPSIVLMKFQNLNIIVVVTSCSFLNARLSAFPILLITVSLFSLSIKTTFSFKYCNINVTF